MTAQPARQRPSPAATKPLIVCLLGPTAAGKSDLALALCHAWNGEIISADSAQVYRGMDIGTAKPDAATRRRVPHHLIDIRDPSEPYSAARFAADAARLLGEISARGRLPIVVGGSMFYFWALLNGLPVAPAAPVATRRRWEGKTSAELHRMLAAQDALSAARIHPNNRQRLLRALEIHQLTRQAPSSLPRSPAPAAAYRPLSMAVTMPRREQLHRRIDERAAQQLRDGLVREVERLRARGDLDPELPALRSVCYRQVWECLDGHADRATMESRIVAANRQLARRQLTWLRRWPDLHWLQREGAPSAECASTATLLERASALLRAQFPCGMGPVAMPSAATAHGC